MAASELFARLNNPGYIHWLKAGLCLHKLRDALHPFTDGHMRDFHKHLLNQSSLLRRSCETSSCRPRKNKLSGLCRVCDAWRAEILRHHRQPDATVNWDNCSPPCWSADHWEVAKAYMPRGQGKVKAADQCDASALLNLINYCDFFQSVDPKLVREVIRYRNDLMHSCEMSMTDGWMRHYQTTLKNFVQHFSYVPSMAVAGQEIKQLLMVDLSLCVSGLEQLDFGALDEMECDHVQDRKPSADLISQWEAELIQERLQELLHAGDDDDDIDDPKTQDTEQLRRLGGFIQANRDLGERFSEELRAITSLEARK